ncbi:MAG: TetR/AcrR family transcriptional regulator [Eubacterium sp.]|nr:TetR/AcrR family transcriptional regulator [Eubacterium sp.]
MEKKTRQDLRYKKTEALIRSTFRDMILEMDYAQITIRELTERANMNRKTFYLHYNSLDSLLGSMQTEIYEIILQSLSELRFPEDFEKLIRGIFSLWDISDEADKKILYSRGNFPIGKSPGDYARKAMFRLGRSNGYLSKYNAEQIELVDAYLNGAITFISWQKNVNKWSISTEELIWFTTKLISQGLFSLELPE